MEQTAFCLPLVGIKSDYSSFEMEMSQTKRKGRDEEEIDSESKRAKEETERETFAITLFDCENKSKMELLPGKTIVLGRGKMLRIKDKRVAKQQLEIRRDKESDDYCIVKMVRTIVVILIFD